MFRRTARLLRLARRWRSLEAEHMPRYDQGYETPKWRTFWLMIGFAVLVGVGVVTILRPELEDEPSKHAPAQMATGGESETDEPLQE